LTQTSRLVLVSIVIEQASRHSPRGSRNRKSRRLDRELIRKTSRASDPGKSPLSIRVAAGDGPGTGTLCDIHYRWQVVSVDDTIMAAG